MGRKATDPSVEDQKLSEFFSETIAERDISQSQLHKRSGITASRLHYLLRGDRPFYMQEVFAICEALSLNPAQVIRDLDDGDVQGKPAPVTPLPAPEPEPYIPPHRRPGFSPEQVAAKKAWQDNAEHIDSI